MTNDEYIHQLRNVVQDLHNCTAMHTGYVKVHEVFQGQVVWDGDVEIFRLNGHPKATTCYAWSHEDADGKEQFVAVLELPPVDGPHKAVQVAIASQGK